VRKRDFGEESAWIPEEAIGQIEDSGSLRVRLGTSASGSERGRAAGEWESRG